MKEENSEDARPNVSTKKKGVENQDQIEEQATFLDSAMPDMNKIAPHPEMPDDEKLNSPPSVAERTNKKEDEFAGQGFNAIEAKSVSS